MKETLQHAKYFVIGFVILFACCSDGPDKQNKTKFAQLPEQEQRLPANALAGLTVADGLQVELFASEPMLTNPTNISVDQEGRVWVCEAYNYDVEEEQEDQKGDLIIVLEDTDHDGKADKKTIF